MKRKFNCPRCNLNHIRPSHRYCAPCHAKFMREWRKNHPLNDEQKKKDICRSYAYVYLKRNRIIKKPCEKCGDINSQMHHSNYDEPLNIIWLCRKHHLELHKELNK